MTATLLSFTVIILLALMLFLLFGRRRRLFVEHLVFAMDYYSFVLITAMLANLLFVMMGSRVPGYIFLIPLFAMQFWQLTYLLVAIRRFYVPGQRAVLAWPAATGSALLLYLFCGIFITGVQMASGMLAVWLL